MYRIEKILEISSKDLKDIYVDTNFIAATGRDNKVHVFSSDYSPLFTADPKIGYINSIKVADTSLICGGQNGKLAVYCNFDNFVREVCKNNDNSNDTLDIEGKNEHAETLPRCNEHNDPINLNPKYIQAHTENVCTLDFQNDILATGSWDCYAKIWSYPSINLLYSIQHSAIVWSIKIVSVIEEKNDNETKSLITYATGCADNHIRIYQNGSLRYLISHHFSCIRDILIHNDTILSVDNEGIILKSMLTGELLSHANVRDFLYSISVEKNISTAGENGRIYVYDDNLHKLQQIQVPAISCWKIVNKLDKLWVACNDGRIYIYSKDGDIEAEEMLEKIRSQNNAEKEGKEFVSGGEKFKISGNKVYQEIQGEWIFIGDNVKVPDNLFQVEFDNKYYTLSFNNSDNVFEVADEFLRKNKLRDEFRDDIVGFIKSNFKKRDFCVNYSANIRGICKALANANVPVILEALRNKENSSRKEVEECNQLKIDNSHPSGVNNHPRIDNNHRKIESELLSLLESEHKFVALDLYRYFIGQGMEFNMAFLLSLRINSPKEAVTFTRLITNLYADPPYNLEHFHPVITGLRDKGLINDDVLVNYHENRCKFLKK